MRRKSNSEKERFENIKYKEWKEEEQGSHSSLPNLISRDYAYILERKKI